MPNKRRYLSGLDWIIHALDHATRRVSGVGNCSQLVLELDAAVDESAFRASLNTFAALFPMLSGRTARAWTLEPFWKMGDASSIRIETYRPQPDSVMSTLTECVNAAPLHRCEYVVFHLLLETDGSCFVAMTFDHRLLDARGAELFLQLFSQYTAGTISPAEITDQLELSVPSFLPGWKDKFLSGREMMRSVRTFSDQPAVRIAPEEGQKGAGRFVLMPLDAAESKSFTERAYKEAGFLLFMPYALCTAALMFDRICSKRQRSGRYVVPCTTDLRGTDVSLKKLFFNYSSMFFFKLDSAELDDRAALLTSLKAQFFEQAKSGFPKHMQNVMGLMRILPVRVFDWMICRHMQHCFGSFSFASVGSSLFDEASFFGVGVKNLFHMPLIPPQVGIGIFFNQFGGRINVGVSFREGLLSEDDEALVRATLREMI